MSSRDTILNALPKGNSPVQVTPFTDYKAFDNPVEKFSQVLVSIGGSVMRFDHADAVNQYITTQFGEGVQSYSSINGILPGNDQRNTDKTSLADLKVAVLSASMGVAENGAVWLTDKAIPARLLPFICEHLVVVLSPSRIVSTMHHAYDIIGSEAYHFGVFIAGPSKTADIEQSLVLGAHGPKTMTVVLMD